MSPIALIFTYILVWWIVLFMALPFGADPDKKPQIGHGSSAPRRLYFRQKLIVTSLVSLIIVFLIRYCLISRIIPLDVL